jgi:hypothetical protein
MSQVLGNSVGQGSLMLGPVEFIRVKFWRIAWEGVNLNSGMAVRELLNRSCPMNWAVVPQQHQTALKMAQQVPEELNHLSRSRCLYEDESAHRRPGASFGGDGRDFGSADCGRQNQLVPTGGQVRIMLGTICNPDTSKKTK